MSLEFFVVSNSNAAPFVSDKSEYFISAESADAALEKARTEYNHPCGLYATNIYGDANAYHKGEEPLAKWRSERAIESAKGYHADADA